MEEYLFSDYFKLIKQYFEVWKFHRKNSGGCLSELDPLFKHYIQFYSWLCFNEVSQCRAYAFSCFMRITT